MSGKISGLILAPYDLSDLVLMECVTNIHLVSEDSEVLWICLFKGNSFGLRIKS